MTIPQIRKIWKDYTEGRITNEQLQALLKSQEELPLFCDKF